MLAANLATTQVSCSSSSSLEELAGTKNATKLGGTRTHLVDSTRRRLHVKSLEQERPGHLRLSLRCGSCCTPSQTVINFRTDAQKQTERERKRRLQQEHEGALELARVQIGLGRDVHWEWPDPCAARHLDLTQEGGFQVNWLDNDGELRLLPNDC